MESRSIHASSRLLAPVATLAIAVAVAGCGSLGQLPGRVEQPHVVTMRDVDRYPEDSPVRPVLLWWRALQFGSADLAARYYSPELGLTPTKLERLIALGPDILNLRARIRVVDVEKWERRATVLVILTRAFRHPNGRTDKTRSPGSFNLVREDGRWLLSDNRYMQRILRSVQKFVKEAPPQP
jgi:hypothetical protein